MGIEDIDSDDADRVVEISQIEKFASVAAVLKSISDVPRGHTSPGWVPCLA